MSLESQPHPGWNAVALRARPDHLRGRLDLLLAPTLEPHERLVPSSQRGAGSKEEPAFAQVSDARVEGDVVTFAPAAKTGVDPLELPVVCQLRPSGGRFSDASPRVPN